MFTNARTQQWLRDEERRTRRTIARYGWAVQAVLPDERRREPGFAYTIGLTALRHPELVVFGLPHEVAGRALNECGELVRSGGRLTEGELIEFDDWGRRLHLLPVPRPQEVLFAATSMYGPRLRALQLVWDDADGHFPWEPGYTVAPWVQPMPGTFRA